MFGKIALLLWSCAGLVWWLTALRLVSAERRKSPPAKEVPKGMLSIFKPLPPLGAQGLRLVAAGLESFITQLDTESELLLGIHEADRDFTGPFLKRLRTDYPSAPVKVIFRTEPDDVANPKIAWQKILARHAEGELWLWSDADIIAPSDFLSLARSEFAQSGVRMMTFPYVVRETQAPAALLEALFVNVEFYPGVLLLRNRGPVDFGLGAAMLFRREDFEKEIAWDEIGAWLADDFFMGQKLQPVRIGSSTLATVPSSQAWGEALLHDLRWSKTIRWNRPLGSFSRLMIIPVLGWLGWTLFHPLHYFGWIGLVGMIQADVLFAALICRRVGYAVALGQLVGLEVWSLWRVALGILSWVPWPVVWNGRTWWRPRIEMVKST